MARRIAATPSLHSLSRMNERQISRDLVEFVTSYGTKIRIQGGFAWFFRHRDIPHWLPPEYGRKVDGVVAIVMENTIVTTYRDRNFMKKMKHLRK